MTARLKRQGRPRGASEQRSIRVPVGLWGWLERYCAKANKNRDPMIDGKMTPSTIINVAMRDWLEANDHRTRCYISFEEEQAA